MLDAICTLETSKDVIYSVLKFQQLSDDEIELYRQYLICPVCSQKAYYRKASIDGKAACFGSCYHQVDCREFKPSLARIKDEKEAVEVNQILLDSDILFIDSDLWVYTDGELKTCLLTLSMHSQQKMVLLECIGAQYLTAIRRWSGLIPLIAKM